MNVKEEKKISRWFMANLFAVAGAIVTIANLYLFYKLSPLVANISTITSQVHAIENDLTNHKTSNTNDYQSLNIKIDLIQKAITGNDRSSLNSRLSRIEGRLGL